jgi:hypothetical protein
MWLCSSDQVKLYKLPVAPADLDPRTPVRVRVRMLSDDSERPSLTRNVTSVSVVAKATRITVTRHTNASFCDVSDPCQHFLPQSYCQAPFSMVSYKNVTHFATVQCQLRCYCQAAQICTHWLARGSY